jgi:hypothetical protein
MVCIETLNMHKTLSPEKDFKEHHTHLQRAELQLDVYERDQHVPPWDFFFLKNQGK